MLQILCGKSLASKNYVEYLVEKYTSTSCGAREEFNGAKATELFAPKKVTPVFACP